MKWLANLTYLVLAAIAIAICAWGYISGQHIPFARQWPLYEALRTTAAIIFAVVGAWLAIVYPERLKFSFDRATSKNSGGKNFKLLFVPAVHSTVILIILLMCGILAPLLKQVTFEPQDIQTLRGVSYAFVCALTLWQVAIVGMAIAPVEMLMAKSGEEEVNRQIDERFNPSGRRVQRTNGETSTNHSPDAENQR